MFILLQLFGVGPIKMSEFVFIGYCWLTIIYYYIPYVMIVVDILLTTSQFYCVHEEKGRALTKERVARSLACHPP